MSDLLRLALKARIPVVKVMSDDPDHLEDLLKHLSVNRPVSGLGTMALSPNRWKNTQVYYGLADNVPKDVDYNDLLEREITLVVVNPDAEQWPHARDCGSISPPISYIKEQLSVFLTPEQVNKFSRYFAGMSMKDIIETIMLTQARDGSLTPTGVNETKSYLGAGMAGLEALETAQTDYVPPTWAEEWLKIDAPLLDNPKYRELWPKGFMLYGPTGTGKTELSRYIARAMGWPLYRLDLGSLYSRWQGASEQNLRRVLSFISSQGESVFLLDEAEKLFGEKSDGQASLATLLSMLLWWLQGESNRTITVMTANDLSIIPPELYRPGRLDAVHHMTGLSQSDFGPFKLRICARVGKAFNLATHALSDRIEYHLGITQATVVAMIRQEAKKMIVEGKM